jgi:hypothetical protein
MGYVRDTCIVEGHIHTHSRTQSLTGGNYGVEKNREWMENKKALYSVNWLVYADRERDREREGQH